MQAKQIDVYNELEICDVRKLPYMDNSFCSVISNCALEHVKEVRSALTEVARVL